MEDEVLYTLLKSAVSRPIEINFTDGLEVIRFEPYESQYVSEIRLRQDEIATNQVKEYLEQGILRAIGIHLKPSELMTVDDIINEIINARESSTRGVRFFSIDDRLEALENDILDVVRVSDLPNDDFHIPEDKYDVFLEEITEARKNQRGDYSYGTLKKRLDALCDKIDALDYKHIDILELQALPQKVKEMQDAIEQLTRRLQGGSYL